MSARLEAAVLAWDHHWGDRYGDEALEEMGEEVQVALNAADKVMFSEAAIERAAKAIFDVRDDPYDMDEWTDLDSVAREPYLCQARAVVAALREEA